MPAECGVEPMDESCVLALFSVLPVDAFTYPIPAASFSGVWHDDSTFVITTTLDITGSNLAEGASDLAFGDSGEAALQFGA